MKVTFEELKGAFCRVLRSRNIAEDTADACAEMFARTTESGVYSHGVNRFPRFIQQLDNGDIIPDAKPQRVTSLGAIEQWDAQRAIGNLTAKKMMDRAIELASDHGIGLVALRNANHWMRGGSYGWQAAEKGYIGICWTNSIAVMPPWGAKECRIGTNPLIVAIPSTPITMVDMSMSMFSYGMLEVNRLAGRELPVDGGFDDNGQLTKEPGVIEKNRRILRPLCRRGYLSGINVFQSLPRAGQCRQNDVSRHVSGGRGSGIRLADYDRGITHDGVRFAAAAGRLSATLIYRHYDLNYGRRYGDGFNANGVNSYPCIIAIS